MSYNDGGCCGGSGFSMPFAFTMPWGNGNDGGFGGANGMFGWLMSILFFSLFGFGGWGGGFGGRGMPGMFPGMGMMPGAASGNVAAETAALVGQQQTADRVAAIGSDVRQILGQTGGIIEAVNTVGNRAQDGFARLDTNLCQLGHAQSMQAVNNYNGLTNQLTDMRFAAQQCCCDTKQLIQSSFCDLRHQMQVDKCDTDGKIAASTAAILAQLNADKFERMQEKLAKANAIIATQKAEADNQRQTAQLAALIQQQPRGCAPYAGCSPCGNPCLDGLTKAVTEAFGDRISAILFPPTTTTAAA